MQAKRLNIYIFILIVIAIICYIFAYKISFTDNMRIIGTIDVIYLAIFVLLAFLAESFYFMYGQMAISTGFAITIASTLYFGVFWSMIIISLGVALRITRVNKKTGHILNTPINKTLFNISNMSISIFSASLGYLYLVDNSIESSTVMLFIRFLLYVFFFLIINTLLISVLISILSETNFIKIFIDNIRYGFLSIVFIAPLGIILNYLFLYYKFIGVVIFMIPLLLLKYIFKLYIQ